MLFDHAKQLHCRPIRTLASVTLCFPFPNSGNTGIHVGSEYGLAYTVIASYLFYLSGAIFLNRWQTQCEVLGEVLGTQYLIKVYVHK